MAKSINKVILVGNVGKDPEMKYTPNGVPVAKFSLATNERFKDKSGEWQDRTEWHNEIVARDIVLLGSPERSCDADRDIPEGERESVHAGTGETDDGDIPF
jgi:hypothetical protein